MVGVMGWVDVKQARTPALMRVSKPMTRPEARACPFIIPIPAATQRLDAPAALAPEQCRCLLDALAQLTDPRHRRGRRHPLTTVLAVAVVAVLAGATSLAAIGEWASDAPCGVLATLGVRRDLLTRAFRPPGEATVRRVLARIDPDALDLAIGRWLADQQPPPPTTRPARRLHPDREGQPAHPPPPARHAAVARDPHRRPHPRPRPRPGRDPPPASNHRRWPGLPPRRPGHPHHPTSSATCRPQVAHRDGVRGHQPHRRPSKPRPPGRPDPGSLGYRGVAPHP